MTRPDEPFDDRAMPAPDDPWAAADQPGPTVHLGGPVPDFGRAAPQPTVYFGDGTIPLGGPTAPLDGSTVHLGRNAALPGQPTAHLGGATAHPGQTVSPPGQPTVHLGGATSHLGQTAASPGQPTVYSGGATAHLGDPGATVSRGSADGTVPLSAPTSLAGHADGSAPTIRAQDELRFGPGVPATPVGAPTWPGAATTRRRRPLWRRLVSLLSSLLTLVLVGVVGFYIWQRLSPLEVEGVTVTVPQPAGDRCDVTVDVVATVRTNGRSGVIRYQWFRSDARPSAILTEQVGTGKRTAALTLQWTFSGTGKATETATVNIIEPSPLQVGTQVEYRCQG